MLIAGTPSEEKRGKCSIPLEDIPTDVAAPVPPKPKVPSGQETPRPAAPTKAVPSPLPTALRTPAPVAQKVSLQRIRTPVVAPEPQHDLGCVTAQKPDPPVTSELFVPDTDDEEPFETTIANLDFGELPDITFTPARAAKNPRKPLAFASSIPTFQDVLSTYV
jgi:hypothetical protein